MYVNLFLSHTKYIMIFYLLFYISTYQKNALNNAHILFRQLKCIVNLEIFRIKKYKKI